MSSSIHIGKVSSGSFLHNDRTQKVSYLIDDSSLNECSRSSSYCLAEYQSLKLKASENYTKLTSQKMQKSTIFLKEAIVNLQEHHTLKDLAPIKERLESYGFKVLQISIHRDEGFINPQNKKEKNYHAHITMFNLDIESGKSVKFGKDYRTELSKLQTFTAKTLQMERGKVSVKEHADELRVTVSKASKRLDTHDYKKAMKIKEEALRSEQYNFKAMQQKITSLEALTTEQKRELHSLNSAVKNDKGTIEELNKRIEELTEHKKELISAVKEALKPEQLETVKALEPLPAFKKAREFVKENVSRTKEEHKTLSEALQATIPLQAENETLKERLSVLKQDMSVLRAENDELTLTIVKKDKTIQSNKSNQKGFEEQVKTFDKDQSKPWYSRLMAYVNDINSRLKESLRENIKLKNELQEYKALVSDKVKELVPNEDELMKFKKELPKKLFNTSANDLKKELSYSYDVLKNEKIKIIDEHIEQQVKAIVKNSNAITREDLRKDDQTQKATKSQSSDYGYSR